MPLFVSRRPLVKNQLKRQKITIKQLMLVTLGMVIVLLGATAFIFLYKGSSSDIESIADQLRTNKDWQLVTSSTEPPRIICLGDNPCPSVHRAWRTNAVLSRSDFEKLLTASDWGDFVIEDDCTPQKNVLDRMTVCRAVGMHDNYRVEVVIGGNYYDSRDNRVSLFIRQK